MHRFVGFVTAVALIPVCALAQQSTYHATIAPEQDPALTSLTGGAMLAIPGLFSDFVIAGGGQFVVLANGDARLTGRIHSETSLYSAFLVDLEFSGRVAPGAANHPVAGSPNLLLDPTAYAPVGPVDPALFVYYTTAVGTLRGTHEFDGAIIDVALGAVAAQIGSGANNRNGVLGLEAELALTVAQQPTQPFGPLNTATLRCDLPASRTDAATHPQVDPTRSAQPFGRAMSLPGIGDDYMFVPAGELIEFDDGHAELDGRLASISQLDDAWKLSLTLTNRIDPGQTGYPPAGSPVLQMLPSAYTANGGSVDPSHWRYYRTVTGTLTGHGTNLGGSITLANGTAAQFGGGANQSNLFHGGYVELAGTVATQPTARTIALTGDPEFYFVGARFPVLPFPTLIVPATPYTLPTLTDQGFVLEGDNLAWVELVAMGANLVGLGDESDWYSGWIRVIDNQHLEVHPQPGLEPGVYDLVGLNPAVITNLMQLTLTAPATPALYAERAVSAPDYLHLMMHKGGASAQAVSVLGLSFSPLPTTLPGLVSLGIGNQGLELAVVGGSFGHDAITGIAQFDIGPIPPGFTGFSIYYQSVVADLANFTLPLPASNVWAVDF